MRRTVLAILLAVNSLAAAPTFATTKGLNQIVTPDVQPFGILSVSFQQQDPSIANRYEVQAELGITRRFEVAAFQGYSPPEQVVNAEYALLQNGPNQPYLLSAGFFNWTTQGSAPQPYVEGGYYKGNTQLMLGVASVITQQPGCRWPGPEQPPDAGYPRPGLPRPPARPASARLPERHGKLHHGGLHL